MQCQSCHRRQGQPWICGSCSGFLAPQIKQCPRHREDAWMRRPGIDATWRETVHHGEDAETSTANLRNVGTSTQRGRRIPSKPGT